MIIVITGKPGSGKTTVAKKVAEKLGLKHYSTGDIRGEIAQKHAMTIDELNEVGKTEFWTDKEVDEKVEKIGKEEDDIVFDSWLAWNFIPQSVKIFLEVDPKIGAERVFKHQRPDEEKKDSSEQVQGMLENRWRNTAERYKKYYDVDLADMKNFQYIIDTTNLNIDAVVEKIKEIVESLV